MSQHSLHRDRFSSVVSMAECVDCGDESSPIRLCEQCFDDFCAPCFLKAHTRGNRALHTFVTDPSDVERATILARMQISLHKQPLAIGDDALGKNEDGDNAIKSSESDDFPLPMQAMQRQRSELQTLLESDRSEEQLLAEHNFFTLCKKGQATQVNQLLTVQPGLLRAVQPQFGWTPLHYAAGYGQAEVVTLLLSKGCARAFQDYRGLTPLHEACYWSQGDWLAAAETIIGYCSLEQIYVKDRGRNLPWGYLDDDDKRTAFRDVLKRANKLLPSAFGSSAEESLDEISATTDATTLYDDPVESEQDFARTKADPLTSHGDIPLSAIIRTHQADQGLHIFKFADLCDVQYLASGNSGDVFAASVVTPREGKQGARLFNIVVKVPKLRATAPLLKELQANNSAPPHPHVLPLLGVCYDFGHDLTRLCFVSERCARGALRDLLVSRAYGDLCEQPQLLLGMALQIAQGLAHLHMHDVIHRDLATRNILVSKLDVLLVADFGMSRILRSDQQTKTQYYHVEDENAALPLRWCPPESLEDLKFSPSSDVWSFGMTLYELVNDGRPPFGDLTARKIYASILRGAHLELLPLPQSCPTVYRELVYACLSTQPERRPSMALVVEKLEHALTLKTFSSETPDPEAPAVTMDELLMI